MKKTKSIVALILALLMLYPGLVLPVTALKSGDYTYKIENGTAIITKYNGSSAVVHIPSTLGEAGVAGIGDYAFESCANLTGVTIPDSVTSIGISAFEACARLTDITIGTGVTSIGYQAFYNTGYYKNADNWNNGVLYIGGCLIQAKQPLSGSCQVKPGTVCIADYAFEKCARLTNVAIPADTASVGAWAFYACTGLTGITADPNNSAYCSDTYGILYNKNKTVLIQYPMGNPRAAFTVPEGVKSIGTGAFYGCANLTGVTMPNSVTSIGTRAFEGCTGLTGITIPGGVTSIEEWTFHGCTSLTSVAIPDSITRIAPYAFTDTGYYNKAENWENNVLYIGKFLIQAKENLAGSCQIKSGTICIAVNAFRCCKSLTAIAIPESVTRIADGAFDSCENLTSVTIPESAAAIGIRAFYGCEALKGVRIPDGVASIGKDALGYYWNGEKNRKDKVRGFIIYCSANTASEQYAVENGFDHALPADKPAPGIVLSNVASSGKIKVAWNNIGAEKYEVYRAAGEAGKYKLIKTTTALSFINTSAAAGKTYFYKVRGVFSDGAKGAFSAVKSRTCDLARPVVTASNVTSSGRIKLTWAAINGAVSYKVYRSASETGTYKLMKTTAGTSYVNTSAAAGEKYYYKVKAIAETGAANSAYSAVTSRTAKLARPTANIALNDDGKPVVSWGKIDGAVSYNVYRATSKNGTFKLMKNTTSLSYTNSGAASSTTYYYKVKAICGNTTGSSEFSRIVSIRSE